MSLREIRPGVWDVQVYGRKRPDGTRERFTRRVHGGIRTAQKVETDLKSARDQGRPIGPTPKISEYAAEWLESRRPDIEPQTHHNYRRAIACYITPHVGDLKLAKLTPGHVRRLYQTLDGLNLSGTTRRYVHRVLSMIMRQAVQDRLVSLSPCEAVKPPKESRQEPRALPPEEVRELLRHLEGTPIQLPAIIAYDTGLRRGELLALTWEDVDFKAGVLDVHHAVEQVGDSVRIKQPKSERSRRKVKLSDPAAAALKAHHAEQKEMRVRYANLWRDQGLVFPSVHYHDPEHTMGRIWTPYAFSKAWRTALNLVNEKRLGEHVQAGGTPETFDPWEFGPHLLRHTHATHLLQGGVRDEVVSRALGHSSSYVTRTTYSHVIDGEQAETAKVTGQVLRGSA
jgi:integrase